MRKWKIHIPEGVQDYLPEECYAKRQMEQAIRALWRRSGYREIETPTFEYYDVFGTGIGAMDAEQVFKFFDDHGRILALRPDMTMPIARIVSTRMADAPTPLRLFYIGSAFGYDVSRSGQQREFSQAGIERCV